MSDPLGLIDFEHGGLQGMLSRGASSPADILRKLIPGLSLEPFQFPSLQHLDDRVQRACEAAVSVDGLSPATTETYETAYDRFRNFLSSEHLAERFIAGNLDEQRRTIESWIAWLRMSRSNHTTVNTYYRSLHALFARIARADGLVDPTALVASPRPGQPYIRFLTKNALEEIFGFVRNYQWARGAFARDRNLALIAIMALGGCRLGEVVRLEVDDVDIEGRTIRIKKGKGRRGGKPRTVYMPLPLQAALERYLAARAKRDLATPRFFVSTWKDMGITADTIARLCRRITTRTGIKVAPHMLRHTAATLMRQSGVADRLAMDQLGHASLVALQRYSHVANGELHSAVMKVDVDIGIE